MADKYKNLKVKELQELLQKQGIPHTGKKEELIERLMKHDERKTYEIESLEAEFGSIEDFDESKLNFDDLHDVDLKSFSTTDAKQLTAVEDESKAQAEKTEISVTETTTDASSTQNSVKISQIQETVEVVKPGSHFKFTPISFEKPGATTATATNATAAAASVAESAQTTPKPAVPSPTTIKAAPAPAPTLSEVEKKILAEAEKKAERAKRFGVQLDEKAKKELRAARFGIPVAVAKTAASPSKSTPKVQTPKVQTGKTVAPKGIDPETLKKRAERFGLPQKGGKIEKNGKSTVLDPVEEEKKRKRAERFGSDQSKKQKN
ncbi:hypothetical protein J3Q64DRAFT_1164332 [Phycomyces blakesleeanus]|uniref:SAP domain-containing protein n=2 Tax=Phycomyces blakesleeanus TaxID=4837 RepID=A0A162X6K7_PHYB8|nr:hypothetical protein PHYBLDRAFT_187204 [Phycomyces blakesleeanus NRRL 1555(-)]OAD72845.1 hypothetical protein PHYBLDRAFT_187204 [Phycomyces blakesleeanus NRRL 1555(-)]|eukprot:XP_018290885.1 hypothetical protein PHYBLDRAFT_187204 [Phycomyces blakesleeanus NRRL 1555(-)]